MYTIHGELTDFAKYDTANRTNRYAGAEIKKEETERVYYEILDTGVKEVTEYPVTVEFNWYSKNKRIDIDNVCFAKKFILDGLVLAKVLQDDSRKFVGGLRDNFFIDKENPRVEINIYAKEIKKD